MWTFNYFTHGILHIVSNDISFVLILIKVTKIMRFQIMPLNMQKEMQYRERDFKRTLLMLYAVNMYALALLCAHMLTESR